VEQLVPCEEALHHHEQRPYCPLLIPDSAALEAVPIKSPEALRAVILAHVHEGHQRSLVW
jgi:hypothetical protein